MIMKRPLVEITAIYIIILLAGYLTYIIVPIENNLCAILVADLMMTIVSYAFSLMKKNSSVYDAYWSVIPFFFIFVWMSDAPFTLSIYHWFVAIVFSVWSWRLTFNWARSWTGWQHEDWRYVDFRTQYPTSFEFINFFGIHLFPTLMVFAGSTALYYFFNSEFILFPVWCIVGSLISVTGILLEFFADNTLFNYRKQANKKEGEVLREGLWKYSRNPNYLGEMLFWIGVAIAGNSVGDVPVWTVFGAIAMVLMFLFASIPMKEKRQSRKAAFRKYKEEVSMLIPWRVKK
jgi:steroid 5-alpha reductase family enzyme